jgi:hypothetical protein
VVFTEAGKGVVGWCMRIAVCYRECHRDITGDLVSTGGFLFLFPFIFAALRGVDRIHADRLFPMLARYLDEVRYFEISFFS